MVEKVLKDHGIEYIVELAQKRKWGRQTTVILNGRTDVKG